MIYEKKIKKAPIIILCIIIATAIIIPYSVHARNKKNYSKYCELGDASMGDGRYSDAIMYFSGALEYEPNNKELKLKMERASKLMKSKAAFEKGLKESYDKHYDEAIKAFEAVNELDQDRYEVAQEKIKQCRVLYVNNFVDMAREEAGKGNIEVAISYLDKAIFEDPTNTTAVTLKNECTLILQKKAEEEIRKQQEELKRIAKKASQNSNQNNDNVESQETSTPDNTNNADNGEKNQQTEQPQQPQPQPQENQTTTP